MGSLLNDMILVREILESFGQKEEKLLSVLLEKANISSLFW